MVFIVIDRKSYYSGVSMMIVDCSFFMLFCLLQVRPGLFCLSLNLPPFSNFLSFFICIWNSFMMCSCAERHCRKSSSIYPPWWTRLRCEPVKEVFDMCRNFHSAFSFTAFMAAFAMALRSCTHKTNVYVEKSFSIFYFGYLLWAHFINNYKQ